MPLAYCPDWEDAPSLVDDQCAYAPRVSSSNLNLSAPGDDQRKVVSHLACAEIQCGRKYCIH